VLDLVRAKHDVFMAQKALADCIIQENEVLASLLKVHAAAPKRKIDETDIGLGCIRIIFKDHSWSHIPPNHPLQGQGQSSSCGACVYFFAMLLILTLQVWNICIDDKV